MNSKYIVTFLSSIIAALVILFYYHRIPSTVQAVIETSDNRKELEQVINHYRDTGEKLKVRAAFFLISNLKKQYHYDGEGANQYRKMFRLIADSYDGRGLNRKWDSLQTRFAPGFPGKVSKVEDIRDVKSAYLIRHIDAAFNAWSYPWAKDLSFDDFCQFILPYKIVNETPDSWMTALQTKNRWILKSKQKNIDRYDACLLLNNSLRKNFYFDVFPARWDINFSELNILKAGSCYHATQYTAYTMRAMGIPVVMDFTPFWGNLNGGHEWNALIYHNRPIPFVGAESDPGKTKIDLAFLRKRGKIFRHTYQIQPDNLIRKSGDQVPSFLTDYNIKDVTKQYIPVSNIQIQLNGIFPDAKYVYINVFNRQSWCPLFYGYTDDDGKAVFTNMGRGIAYLPMYYESGGFVPAAAPVILTAAGKVNYLRCNVYKKKTIIIHSKGPQGPQIKKDQSYELFYWKDEWLSAGKINASADSLRFKQVPSNTLYWIHNSEKSAKERIFTYENNKQIWW